MKIKEMFKDDINRTINGVVQVEQEQESVVAQEVQEYVVTAELKKRFMEFFNAYSDSFDTPTNNIGVWITGFFGSGKSHFLKMLSYLLENKEINGKKTVEYFSDKFDDEASFMNIQKSVQVPTETILFNIDVEGSVKKDDTAVLRVFAKVFYDHLGFYGRDLKLARLERYITNQGKYEDFKEAFQKNRRKSWLDSRGTYQFFKKDVIKSAVESGAMDEESATLWLSDKKEEDYSIEELVEEIKEYVDSKPKGFRLLFMIDEAGQYIGTNTSMLLNLQNLIEQLGSVCRGQVWVVATGQEALDDMIKVRQDEFSRIMARFAIRLSLTSSSVGEVIEKRLLTKTDEANTILENVYNNNENVLNNLYAFDADGRKDLKGYRNVSEFTRIFPFVPYQFRIMQDVFNEIRKNGHAGKHQSSGERSMLNGFQESAQNVEYKNELTLVPMYAFYDTLHSFLDTSVRAVIERAEKAAEDYNGLTEDDVNLLKLLYLVKYINYDIKSNIENLTILMADSITVDKLVLKENVEDSLAHLEKQNYISRNGDVYQFLTDEEQDIARKISNQSVDSSEVISKICSIIFDEIYTTKKYRYVKDGYNYDFEFGKAVDRQNHGGITEGMKLRFVTAAADRSDYLELQKDSQKNNEAICKLANDDSIFDNIEKAIKINKYIRQRNVNQLPESSQTIIINKNKEEKRLMIEATSRITQAILDGEFYISGEVVSFKGSSVKVVLDKAMEYLVEHTYKEMKQIDESVNTDADIRNILNGNADNIEEMEANKQACDTMYNYLEAQEMMRLPTSMADIQSRYQDIPYGWKEIDIAAVVARLIRAQKITIKRSGETIGANDYKIVDYLRKKSEIGSTTVLIRESIPPQKLRTAKRILKEYFDINDVPNDEDGLIAFIKQKFNSEKFELENMQNRNQTSNHPGEYEISEALGYIQKVLLAQNDILALITTICNMEYDLLDSKEAMIDVKNFYKSQITLYDDAVRLKHEVEHVENDYLMSIPEIKNELDKISEITKISKIFKYNRIPELNESISIINDQRNILIVQKKEELNAIIKDCLQEVRLKASESDKLNVLLTNVDAQFESKKQEISRINKLVQLDAKKMTIIALKDSSIRQMEQKLSENNTEAKSNVKPKRKQRDLDRIVLFKQVDLSSEEDIDKYLLNIKNRLMSYINDDEEIHIK